MIRFALRCTHGHSFESWFQSADAYETLRARSLVTCPDCGASDVEKALMAPQVRPGRVAKEVDTAAQPPAPKPDPRAEAIAKVKAEIEANSDYVGMSFAKEARAIHEGTAPERAIYGEAKPEEAKKLLEDGVPVAPLPFIPKSKTN